eukprot:TRINITY_DN3796_c0_g1_i9.p1 TRINITY_DN3796_c0_g1~~TRINITY_DN3796_c0_g1_i9.p1  ORF type:complete len:326 (-),score=-24.54 TRINITY_DN3796_c0_g1_i9:231-1088(-)
MCNLLSTMQPLIINLNITMWAGVPSEPLCLHTQSLATAQYLHSKIEQWQHIQKSCQSIEQLHCYLKDVQYNLPQKLFGKLEQLVCGPLIEIFFQATYFLIHQIKMCQTICQTNKTELNTCFQQQKIQLKKIKLKKTTVTKQIQIHKNNQKKSHYKYSRRKQNIKSYTQLKKVKGYINTTRHTQQNIRTITFLYYSSTEIQNQQILHTQHPHYYYYYYYYYSMQMRTEIQNQQILHTQHPHNYYYYTMRMRQGGSIIKNKSSTTLKMRIKFDSKIGARRVGKVCFL